VHAKSHQRRCSSRARPLAKVKRRRGKLIGGREALRAKINGIALSSSAFRFRCSQVEAQPIVAVKSTVDNDPRLRSREYESCTAKLRTPELRVKQKAPHHKRSAHAGSGRQTRSATVFPA
jgi:hypothetical protein